jgi:SAM-dependent methyltransferase
MELPTDTNAEIWKSEDHVQTRTARSAERERKNAAQWQLLAELLPFGEDESFTFLDLGSGTGSAARKILDLFPKSAAILSDFSPQMIAAGEEEMAPYSGRYRYVEFDMSTGTWPSAIPDAVDAVVTSMCIHHMPDHRKAGLFAEIFERLEPGGWYFNYDAVSSADPLVAAAWERTGDRLDPEAAYARTHRTEQEQARHENHVLYLIPLAQQLEYFAAAGFVGIDVYWKRLDDVIYGGRRP